MYNGMMDPELLRIAQEQMSRISPEELARIQQQMLSNPDLVKLASESMKNMKPEDLKHAAEQLKHTRTEDMVEISEKVAKATPEEIAAMKSHADGQISYALSAAQTLKQQGNEFHSRGQYRDAANKYLLAKNNVKGIPSSKGGTLQLQCSLNLMSCYLKTGQFEECITEGSEVLSYDSKNIKALYRRGQAYKELGNLEAAVSDLRKANEVSPEDETVADAFRDVNDKLMKDGNRNVSGRLVIEEVEEEETRPTPSESHKSSSVKYSVSQPAEVGESSQNGSSCPGISTADADFLQSLGDNPEGLRRFQNCISNANPDTLAAMGVDGMSPDLFKAAQDMMTKMKPEELQKMLQVASSLSGKDPSFPMTSNTNAAGLRSSPQIPEFSPEMIKMASDTVRKMSPEELQKMVEVSSSLNMSGTAFPRTATDGSSQRSGTDSHRSAAAGSSTVRPLDKGENYSGGVFPNSSIGQSPSSLQPSSTELQESLRNSMKDPAMQQMFTSMMKNMSPEMMANMSEQFGMKLSKEDAAKAQQAMSSLSPEDLEKMMKWAERAQRGVETARKTKNWLLGKPGLILAIVMLILAFIFRQLGFIGG